MNPKDMSKPLHISFKGKVYKLTGSCGCPNHAQEKAFKQATGHDYWDVYWGRVRPIEEAA